MECGIVLRHAVAGAGAFVLERANVRRRARGQAPRRAVRPLVATPAVRAQASYAESCASRPAPVSIPVGGSHAPRARTGLHRPTEDLDVPCKPADARRALGRSEAVGRGGGFEDERWIGEARRGEPSLDAFFTSGGGTRPVDDGRSEHACRPEVLDAVPSVAPTKPPWREAGTRLRHRHDGFDAVRLVPRAHDRIDRRRPLARVSRRRPGAGRRGSRAGAARCVAGTDGERGGWKRSGSRWRSSARARPGCRWRARSPRRGGAWRSSSANTSAGPAAVVRGSGVWAHWPQPRPGSGGADVIRASEFRHAVEGVGGDRHLGRPALVLARAQPAADHLLPSPDRGLGFRAPRVA